MVSFIRALQSRMSTPTWFGWYHLIWLGIVVAACILILVFRNKFNRRAVNIVLLSVGILLVLLEVVKQLYKGFSINDTGNLVWHYPPADFPFQFCSTPMYLFVLAGIIRKGKIYNTLTSYLATYAFLAGVLVMIYPLGVYVENIFINIHTMIWHSSMLVLGFMLLATRTVELCVKSVLKATIVFVIMLTIAILMNVFAHLIVPDEYFNMFYIGPYYPNNFVILQDIYQHVPWVVFILIYIIGFFLSSMIIMLAAMFFDKLIRKCGKRTRTDIKA